MTYISEEKFNILKNIIDESDFTVEELLNLKEGILNRLLKKTSRLIYKGSGTQKRRVLKKVEDEMRKRRDTVKFMDKKKDYRNPDKELWKNGKYNPPRKLTRQEIHKNWKWHKKRGKQTGRLYTLYKRQRIAKGLHKTDPYDEKNQKLPKYTPSPYAPGEALKFQQRLKKLNNVYKEEGVKLVEEYANFISDQQGKKL